MHVSQVTDDYINYDGKRGALIGKESKKSLEEGNKVRARIVALSLKGKSSKETKIGLTMRQPGLGRFEWIEEEKDKGKKSKPKGKKNLLKRGRNRNGFKSMHTMSQTNGRGQMRNMQYSLIQETGVVF